MTLQRVYKSPPSARHLAWALPVAVLVATIVWWAQSVLWTWGDEFRQPRSYTLSSYSYTLSSYWNALPTYLIGALVGSVAILLANWSRRMWPRIVLAAFLVAIQVVTATMFMLIPRAT